MFGSILRSKKNPKGPDLNRLDDMVFDLSGNLLTCSIPRGNWHQLPNPQGDVFAKTNLYDMEQFTKAEESDTYSTRLIFSRFFSYSCFNHSGLGRFELKIVLHKQDNLESGLFDPALFQKLVKTRVEHHTHEYNKDIEDEFLKSLPFNNYRIEQMAGDNFLTYGNNIQQSPEYNYAIPVTSGHYIIFSFHFMTHLNNEEPWFFKARELEKQIMNSVKLKLTDNFKQEKAALSN